MSNAKIFNQDVAFSFYTNERYAENLLYHTKYGLFYLYEEGHYKKLTPQEFKKEVTSFIRKNFPRQNWTIHAVDDIIKWVQLECLRQSDKEDRHLIGFKECIYNTKTFETEEFSRDKIVTYYLPFFYSDTTKETPTFNRFIESSLVKLKTGETDHKLIAVAQEMFGSIFIDNLKASKAFFLYGESGQNGKSTFTKLVRKVIGPQFTSHLALSDLGKTFGLAPLIGMKVNIRDELDDKFGSSKIFKELVTGDTVGDQHKYGDHFTLSNRAKFIFSSNVIATFDGIDGGLRRRLLFIPFYREFKDGDVDKDYDLEEKLEDEIPGIVGWALIGAKRLVDNQYRFTKSESVTHVMEEFEDEASSALRFFRDNYAVDRECQVWNPLQKVYDDYLVWMVSEGSKKPAGKKRFVKDIKGVWQSLDIRSQRSKDQNYTIGKTISCINAYRKDASEIEGEEVSEEEAKQLGIEFKS